MKRVYLQKIKQHGSTCYIGKINPRDLVRVATKVGMSEAQDAQRPLNEKRVKDIAKYVGIENGILPSTLTIATKDNRFILKEYDAAQGLFYIDFPETDDEFAHYLDAVDVMDGQHRLYSFLPEIRVIQDDAKFDVGFTMYFVPTLDERRKIFISCNEKQEKVSGNLLMWFKEKLNMLTTDEKTFYNIVAKLSNNYPLKGHVIMSAEKLKNGVKAKEVIAALKKAGIQDMAINGNPLNEEQKVKVICLYLSAWEKVVGFSFSSSPSKVAGAAIKMAGLRYMLFLLPTVWDRAIASRRAFNEEFVEETLKKFIASYGVEREFFFTGDENKMWFRDRTGVEQFANEGIIKIKSLDTGNFNPLA